MSTPFDPKPPKKSPSKAEPAPAEFPQIDLNREVKKPPPAKGKEAKGKDTKAKDTESKTPSSKKTKNDPSKNNHLIWISVASAGGLLLVFFMMMSSGGDKAYVSVRWKTSERQGARISVDGKSRKVPSSENFKLTVKPGQQVLDFHRDGYNDVRHEPIIKAGNTATIDLSRWTPNGSSKSGRGR